MVLIRSRSWRIGALISGWLIVHQAATWTDGFQNGPILCPFRLLTGLSCPACGCTRAIGAISLGQFHSAWIFNPLAFVFALTSILWAIKLPVVSRFFRNLVSSFNSQEKVTRVLSLLLLYLASWLGVVARYKSGNL